MKIFIGEIVFIMKVNESIEVRAYLLKSRLKVWSYRRGFVLVSCLLVMSLLVLIAVALMQMARVESRIVNQQSAKLEAKNNARLALMMAIGQLQEMTGPDQVVTARAEILSDSMTVENPNWVGVWKTAYEQAGEIDYPLIGKRTEAGEPYAYLGAYSDLRFTESALAENKWKKQLLNGWLVSALEDTNPSILLSLEDESVVELFGRGSMGEFVNSDEYEQHSVRVNKIRISDMGAIAWWTSDNNQKACIQPNLANEAESAVISSLGSNLSFVRHGDKLPFLDFYDFAISHKDKIISMQSSSLTQDPSSKIQEWMKYYAHDFTHHAPGMYTNPVLGGFQRDLTPLLFAHSEKKVVSFSPPSERISEQVFHSEYPIIRCVNHDVLAPTFSALRYWGLKKYLNGNSIVTDLDTDFVRIRSNENWPHAESDGATYDARYWSAEMPKTYPFMTDTRWHYYFSINGQNIRTHIIPRVCLWNPYNRDIEIDEMIVMMPNPFYNTSGGFHFYVEDEEVERLRSEIPDAEATVHHWVKTLASPLGNMYKARLLNEDLFPQKRYLIFTLSKTTIQAGECHVFSPGNESADVSSSGVHLSAYDETNVARNKLSSSSVQGIDHFYFDVPNTQFQIQTSSAWKAMSSDSKDLLDLNKIHDYRPETGLVKDNFPFILKASNSTIPEYDDLISSVYHPSLQLINNGTGGVAPTYYFAYSGSSWGSANTVSSFGSLQEFEDAPYKDAPTTHQVGAKMLWLDEASTEGNRAPLRYGTGTQTRWPSDHMVYHPATIANWNVRAQLTSRSPISQCGEKWYLFSTGPWLLQFIPKSPQDANDFPLINELGTAFVKNPFGLSVQYAESPNVVLFDLPHSDYGIHSIASLRHAMLSPYSWHPSYTVGQSLRDPHAPAFASAHPELAITANDSMVNDVNHWDTFIGGYRAGYTFGAANEMNASSDLLQIGTSSVSRSIDSNFVTSKNEILPYDIAFEVNQSIWDDYFISTLPLDETTEHYASIIPNSQQCEIQYRSNLTNKLIDNVNAAGNGFWLNGYYYRKSSAFNVNSTSVPAWTAFLTSTLKLKREMQDGSILSSDKALYSRTKYPVDIAAATRLAPKNEDAWLGMRALNASEINELAVAIVAEVKTRGPFISLADFVNRRLTDDNDESSSMGALDRAIYQSGLNQKFYNDATYATSSEDRGTDTASVDNNHRLFKESYIYDVNGERKTSQAPIKSWGLPSFMMQSDLLEPLAPCLTVRGDTFTIRAYGEARRKGKIVSTAYIEALVERSPHYIEHQDINNNQEDLTKNVPTDSLLMKDPMTGKITMGNLTNINKKLGRRYQIKSFRWLNEDEI